MVELSFQFYLRDWKASLLLHRFYSGKAVPEIMESTIQWQTLNAVTAGPQDVILLGDSSCLLGLKPNVIQKKTGLRVLNLGTVGYLFPYGHLEMLDLFLRNFRPPKLLVYHIAVASLYATQAEIDGIGITSRFRQWLRDIDELDNPNVTLYHDPSAWLENWFSYLPSYRMRLYLRDWSLQNSPHQRKVLAQKRRHYYSDDQMRKRLKKNRGYIEESTDGKVGWMKKPILFQFELSDLCLEGVEALFEMSNQHGFDVLVVLNPIPELKHIDENRALFQRVEKRIQIVASGYDHVWIPSPIDRYYPNSMCKTVTHLLDHGAERNSEELAELILAFNARGMNSHPASHSEEPVPSPTP